MKVGSSTIIPLGMRSKKHFCYNCGGRLYANPNTRKVYPKDKDWKKYSKIGLHGHMLPVGYVEVTEYNLKCPDCADVKEYDDQLVLEIVQKKTGKSILTDTDLQEHLPSAIEATLKRKKRDSVIGKIIYVIILVLFLLYTAKTGKITFWL